MIVFVRHGLTKYNKDKRFQGLKDIPLCFEGIQQAKEVSEKLKDIKFDIVYCSPLKRAKKTAKIINKFNRVPIIYDKRLIEYDVGKNLVGKVYESLPQEIKDGFLNTPAKYGAQSLDEFRENILSFYKTIEHCDKNILIVSHGGVYRIINQYLTGKFDKNVISNCEVKILEE